MTFPMSRIDWTGQYCWKCGCKIYLLGEENFKICSCPAIIYDEMGPVTVEMWGRLIEQSEGRINSLRQFELEKKLIRMDFEAGEQ